MNPAGTGSSRPCHLNSPISRAFTVGSEHPAAAGRRRHRWADPKRTYVPWPECFCCCGRSRRQFPFKSKMTRFSSRRVKAGHPFGVVGRKGLGWVSKIFGAGRTDPLTKSNCSGWSAADGQPAVAGATVVEVGYRKFLLRVLAAVFVNAKDVDVQVAVPWQRMASPAKR